MRKLPDRLPTGAVTLLLGDVEDSTRLWERDSSRAHAAMFELDAIVAEFVARFDGGRPLEQGEGDNFVAAFARPSDAIACAIEMQRRLADGAVAVRMGVHTGEIDVRDGRYDGPTIIRAARIRDLAYGGQVLVTGATRALTEDVLPQGAGFTNLGPHALKGLDRPEHVFQLTHPALQATFPPVRSSVAAKSTLPVRLSSFIGRRTEVGEVQRLIRENRMVTLTGAGGCGKTRLAVESIEPIANEFTDGVWFCDLGPLADPSVVPQAVRTTIGLREDASRGDIDVLCEHLAGAEALVVLDNCEHLLDACTSLADSLLRECAGMRVLATTREPLGVEGEVAWRVPSLSFPDTADVSPDDAASYESVCLFVDRAQSARADFALTPDNARPVAEICTRLDGIPLAIQLAAARVRVLSVQQILDGLHDRFRMLGRGSRTALARQQTLLASVGWSYDLLTEQQRIVLRRLSVFAGGCTLEAAEHVTSGDGVDAGEVLELVSQLVDRSLLIAEESSFGTRYRMLETIRQFARDRLVDAREADVVAERHLAWFTQWVLGRGRDAATAQRDSTAAILEVEADYDNIRTAVEWSLAATKHATGLRLVSALWHVVVTQRSGTGLIEATRWVERLLDAKDIEPIDRAHGLVALSWMRVFQPDLVGSVMAAVEAEPLARATRDPTLIARALVILGNSNMHIDPQVGLPQLEECEVLAREAGDLTTLSICLMFFSAYYAIIGRPLRGMEYAVEAEQVAIACSNSVTALQARISFAMCRAVQGFLDEGIELVELCLAEFEAAANKWWIATCHAQLVAMSGYRGDRAEVDRRARLALERGVNLGMTTHTALASLFLVPSAVIDGDLDEAERLIAQTVLPPFGWQGRGFEATKGAMQATVLAARGMTDEALAVARASSAEARASAFAHSLHACLAIHAVIARAAGRAAEAEATVQEWLSTIASTAYVVVAADALDLAAALRADVGNDVDAARLFAAADAHRRWMGATRPEQPFFDADAVIASLRERLGPEGFDEAWTAGSTQSVDDAIAFASRGWGARKRPQAGWDSLTPTELKVVELVAEGLSNPQVAERLFMSPRTVSTHLTHVFAKIGVSSRAELAAQAVKRTS